MWLAGIPEGFPPDLATALHGNGICHGNDYQGEFADGEDRGGADHAASRWKKSPCATSQNFPGRMEDAAIFFDVQSEVGVFIARIFVSFQEDSENLRRRILESLDAPPPAGYAKWNGRTLGEALEISPNLVWRELRALGVSLQRRRSWCISTDPEFDAKSADIIGLYLGVPANAVVLSVDEKPCIQALEREQGWLKMPDGRSMTGFAHEYKRHGTTNLFAALNVATGQVNAKCFPSSLSELKI